MRQGLGCLLMLAGAMACFTVIGFLVVGGGLNAAESINWALVGIVLAGAFVTFGVGLVLLTAIPSSDRARRELPWRRRAKY